MEEEEIKARLKALVDKYVIKTIDKMHMWEEIENLIKESTEYGISH